MTLYLVPNECPKHGAKARQSEDAYGDNVPYYPCCPGVIR